MRLNRASDRHLDSDRHAAVDYTHPWVKLRLLIGVAIVMLVLATIESGRDPRFWQFLQVFVGNGAPSEPLARESETDAVRESLPPASEPMVRSPAAPAEVLERFGVDPSQIEGL